MYVSYTPPLGGLAALASSGAGKPCKGGRADARTRTGDPFITSKALAPDASPREGTPAPTTTAIHADTPSGPPTPRTAQETAAVYAIYTPPAPRDGFTHRFTRCDLGPQISLACAAGYHKLCRTLRAGQCACRCHEPIGADDACWACGRRLLPADPSPYCRQCWDAEHPSQRALVEARA